MSTTAQQTNTPQGQPIEVNQNDLPLYCPGPKAPLWSMHPRVYIEISKDGSALCPYCSAHYTLISGNAQNSSQSS